MAVDTFASIEDLEQRFRVLDALERAKAPSLLEDASVAISRELADAGIAVDPEDEQQAAALRAVCCSVAKRAISGGNGEAVSSSSVTTGPFSRQVTYANPTADLFLTRQDKRLLGIPQSGPGFSFARPAIGGHR